MHDIQLEPTGRQVTFKTPSYSDRRQAAKMYEGRGTGYSMEELLGAFCLIKVDGQVVPELWAGDPITRLDSWSLPEVLFYMEVFTSVGLLDDKGRQSALDVAKRLMGGNNGQMASPIPQQAPPGRQRGQMQPPQNSGEPAIA